MPLLSLLTGPLGKIAGYLAIAVAVLAAAAIALHQHDARVLAEAQVAQDQATMAQMRIDHMREVTALQNDAAAAQTAARRALDVEAAIHAAPRSTGCIDRPAIAAAVDRMRANSPTHGAGAPAAGAGQPAGLPGTAPAAAPGR